MAPALGAYPDVPMASVCRSQLRRRAGRAERLTGRSGVSADRWLFGRLYQAAEAPIWGRLSRMCGLMG
jgi:hypothetical protein